MSARRAVRPYLCQSSTRRADIIFRFFFQIFFFFLRDGFRREGVALTLALIVFDHMTSVLCSAFYVLDRRYRSSFLSNHHNTILNIFPSFNDLTLAIT